LALLSLVRALDGLFAVWAVSVSASQGGISGGELTHVQYCDRTKPRPDLLYFKKGIGIHFSNDDIK